MHENLAKNLAIIGTSHISRDSVQDVEDAFERHKPEIVAVELDRRRAHALMHNTKAKVSLSDIKRIGINGYLFALIGGWLQKKLGQYVGMEPGSEMKAAIQIAQKNGAKIALIDRDIEITMKRFSDSFGWKEKLNIIKDLVKAPFSKKISIDLTKVPEKKLIKHLLMETKKNYPNIYRVLVEERNEIMAENIARIIKENPEAKILAVVGAGHEDDMIRIVGRKLNQRT